MTPQEVARVLAKAAAFDRRTVGEGDVLAWLEAIGDLDAADCLAAVTRHYRETNDWLAPSHLRAQVAEIDRDRRRQAARARAALARQQEERLALDRGPVRDRSADVTELVRQVVAALPVTPSDTIHERAKARARREKGRPDKRQQPVKACRTAARAKDHPPPQSDDIAALATRYLLDGHEPQAVADRLGVSRRWCRNALAQFTPA